MRGAGGQVEQAGKRHMSKPVSPQLRQARAAAGKDSSQAGVQQAGQEATTTSRRAAQHVITFKRHNSSTTAVPLS